MRSLDVLIIVCGLYLAVWLYDVAPLERHELLVALAVLAFLFVAEVRGLYQSRRIESIYSEFGHVATVWFVVVILLLALGFVSKSSASFSRVVLTVWILLTPVMMCLLRLMLRKVLRYARARGRNSRTVAFAGAGSASDKMIAHIGEMPWLGLNVVGVFDDRKSDRHAHAHGELSLAGDLHNLVDMACAGQIDIVYITLPMQAERSIIKLIEQLADSTASVYIVPDLFIFSLYKARWATVGGMPVISTFESPFYGTESWLKRAEDIVLGGLILSMIAPLLIIIALGVKLTSAGPVIFKQRRYGLKGEVVEVWKFRSMTVCDNGENVVQAKKGDKRVTPLGAFLRRTSLDELPQFINVLQGRMSIVGPRPHAVAHNEQYRKLIRGYMLRHKVKPGITGLAQVNGWRGETDTLHKMQKRVEYDLEYIQNWSLWLDIKIIVKTIVVGFLGKNAY